MAYPQPPLTSDQGVILTVGMTCNSDRFEIVLPLATDTPPVPAFDLCKDAVNAFINQSEVNLLACLSADLSILFYQGESMVKGNVPYRQDFAAGVKVGARGAGAMPSQVAGLGLYYVDPTQHLAGGRERVAKNFFAGLADGDIVGDIVNNTVIVLMSTFIDQLAQGIVDPGVPGTTWYRVGAAVRQTAQQLPNIVTTVVRDYVATQRRRLVPR